MISLNIWTRRGKISTLSLSLSLDDASILSKIKEGYLLWLDIVGHINKSSRYTLGARIENKFLDLLEIAYAAYFTEKEKTAEKVEKVSKCILVLDVLKFLISIAWEGKVISNKHCENIALKCEEIGRMLGGWKNSLGNPEKKNRNL